MKEKRYSPLAVANEFIKLADSDGVKVSHMKLQKLVYYAHGWSFAIRGQGLINEYIEAWDYGPVTPSLYHELKQFGGKPIDRPVASYSGEFIEGEGWVAKSEVPRVSTSDGDALNLIRRVWVSYRKFSALQLSEMTHRPGGPWDTTRRDAGPVRGADISEDLIRTHFVKLAEKSQSAKHAHE